jgi:hypothetical protein
MKNLRRREFKEMFSLGKRRLISFFNINHDLRGRWKRKIHERIFMWREKID